MSEYRIDDGYQGKIPDDIYVDAEISARKDAEIAQDMEMLATCQKALMKAERERDEALTKLAASEGENVALRIYKDGLKCQLAEARVRGTN